MASEKMHKGALAGFETKAKAVRLLLFPNGTGTPTYKSSAGAVASVARAATGSFNVTLRDSYYTIAHVNAFYCTSADNEDLYAQGGTMPATGATAAAVANVKLKTGATNTDVTANTAKFISIEIIFEDADTVVVTG